MNLIILAIIICIIIFIIYVIKDNYSVKVVSNNISIENLPDDFNNYTVLQITDLHSKEFGKILYNKINKINYDLIAFTGDNLKDNDYNMKSLKNLVNNINNKKIMIYVDGNNGPKTYDEENNIVTEFGMKIESLGFILLKDTYSLEKNNSRIWLSNFDIATAMFFYGKKYYFEEKFKQKFSHLNNDISIGIGHIPATKDILKFISMNKSKCYKYNLIIAGHYHGGQIRIPFYGALFVPTSGKKFKFFPDQKAVSGIYRYQNITQYVSTGLGASNHIPFLNFRLFNTPQIDVIKLIKK